MHKIEIKSKRSSQQKPVDTKVFEYHSLERQTNKKPASTAAMDQVKLSPTKTKRATAELSTETLDAHQKFYQLKTTTYERDKDSITQMTIEADKVSVNIKTLSDRRAS